MMPEEKERVEAYEIRICFCLELDLKSSKAGKLALLDEAAAKRPEAEAMSSSRLTSSTFLNNLLFYTMTSYFFTKGRSKNK